MEVGSAPDPFVTQEVVVDGPSRLTKALASPPARRTSSQANQQPHLAGWDLGESSSSTGHPPKPEVLGASSKTP